MNQVDLLQCAGIFACDCVIEDATIWVGVLVLDPDRVEVGKVYSLIDIQGDRTRYPIKLNVDYTPAYRQRLERIYETQQPAIQK